MKKAHPPVTDHALLRYLERVAGLNVEELRERIYENTKQALAAGSSGLISNGISYKFCHGKVVTVWVEQQHMRPLDWRVGGGE